MTIRRAGGRAWRPDRGQMPQLLRPGVAGSAGKRAPSLFCLGWKAFSRPCRLLISAGALSWRPPHWRLSSAPAGSTRRRRTRERAGRTATTACTCSTQATAGCAGGVGVGRTAVLPCRGRADFAQARGGPGDASRFAYAPGLPNLCIQLFPISKGSSLAGAAPGPLTRSPPACLSLLWPLMRLARTGHQRGV